MIGSALETNLFWLTTSFLLVSNSVPKDLSSSVGLQLGRKCAECRMCIVEKSPLPPDTTRGEYQPMSVKGKKHEKGKEKIENRGIGK
jgi:hypothetical protein